MITAFYFDESGQCTHYDSGNLQPCEVIERGGFPLLDTGAEHKAGQGALATAGRRRDTNQSVFGQPAYKLRMGMKGKRPCVVIDPEAKPPPEPVAMVSVPASLLETVRDRLDGNKAPLVEAAEALCDTVPTKLSVEAL